MAIRGRVVVTFVFGVGFAAASACAANLGFLLKHRGAQTAPRVNVLRPFATAKALLASRWFAIGVAVALFAGVLHVFALALAPLSLVQAVVAAGVVVLAVMAKQFFGARVDRRQWTAVVLTTSGLGLLALTVSLPRGADSAFLPSRLLVYVTILAVVGVGLLFWPQFERLALDRGVIVGAAAGVFFGVTDVGIKALVGAVAVRGVTGTVAPWLVLVLLAGVAAQYVSARGLQLGQAVPVIATTGATATVASVAAGFMVFGDPVPHAPLAALAEGLGFALICVAALLTPPALVTN